MKNRQLIAALLSAVLVLALAFQPVPAFAAPATEDGAKSYPDYDGYLFKISGRGGTKGFPDLLKEAEHVFDQIYWIEDKSILDKLNTKGGIEFVEPNYYVTLFEDSRSSNGWPYDALAVSYPAGYSLTGNGIRIGVIDSGCDLSNADLQNARILEGYDYLEESTEMSDSVYHGTKVIQVIAGDNNSLGMTGIAPEAEIVPLKCFSSSSGGTVRILAQAMRDAVDVYGCDIINMSWGLGTKSSTLYEAVQYVFNRGTLLVAAAGNVTNSYPQGTKIYPAYYDEVISVSAINSGYSVLSTSQMNDGVNICAPGGSVPFVLADGSLSSDSGTSFAAPCIAAVVALVRQLQPAMDLYMFLSAFETRAQDLGEEGYDTAYGYGLPRLDDLIGEKWSYYGLEEIEEVNYPRILGWCVNPAGGRVFVGGTAESGQMTAVHYAGDGSGAFPFEAVITEVSREVTVFYLNSDNSVQCACDRFE